MKPVISIGLLTVLLLMAGWVGAPDAERTTEVARIQDHLGRVLEELRTSPPPDLTRQQRAAREEAIHWLEEYRAAGVFPHNHVRPGERVPVFVDPHGTPCAVGYLMLRSGEVELVEEIAREANLARIPELGGDDRLVRWLHESGLTLEEATRIQPAYDSEPVLDPEPRHADETIGLSLATVAVTSFAALTEPSPSGFDWPGTLSAVAAGSHLVLLGMQFTGENEVRDWPFAVNVMGAFIGSAVALHRFGRKAEARRSEGRASLIPHVGGSGSGVTAGLTVLH